MLNEKIKQAVIEEANKNMFMLKDLQKSYKKVLVFDKLDDLVKHLQNIAQENIKNAKANINLLPISKKFKESLIYDDEQGGGVLIDNKISSDYLVAESDISELGQHFYLAERPILIDDYSKEEQIASAVKRGINENIYYSRRIFAGLVLRMKDIEKAINAFKLEKMQGLGNLRDNHGFNKISRFDSESQLIDYLSQKDQQVVKKYDLGYRLTDDYFIEKTDHAIYLAEK
ncbi:MAG: hypothetical protein N4R51_02045 [Lactobacillus crispatus]|nr:hypothetical protein [Lactobacillus crispatus]